MRYVVLALLLVAVATAQDYKTFTPEEEFKTKEGKNVTVSFNLGEDADFPEKATIYVALKRIADGDNSTTEQKNAATAARNDTVQALARAKADDAAIVRIDGQSLIVRHGECKSTDTEVVCFKSIVYLEEDTQPLGDSTLNQVKYEDGELHLPAVISISPFTQTVEARRTPSKTTLYPGETTTITTLIRNTGNTVISGVRITEQSALSTRDEQTLFKGGVLPSEALVLTYTLTAGNPGNYTITGTFAPSFVTIPDTVITVKEPYTIAASKNTGIVGKPLPFSITITNAYTAQSTLSNFLITTTDAFETGSSKGIRRERQRITLDTTTLAANGNVTINGTILTTAPGTTTLTLTGRFTAAREDNFRQTITYTIKQPGIEIEPTLTGQTVSLRVTNTLDKTVEPITIDWGDAETSTITYLDAGSTTTLTHTYTQGNQATITATAPGTQQQTATIQLAASPVEQPPAEQPVEQPVDQPTEQPVDQPIDQPIEQPLPELVEEPKDERTILTKLLDWIDGLFK